MADRISEDRANWRARYVPFSDPVEVRVVQGDEGGPMLAVLASGHQLFVVNPEVSTEELASTWSQLSLPQKTALLTQFGSTFNMSSVQKLIPSVQEELARRVDKTARRQAMQSTTEPAATRVFPSQLGFLMLERLRFEPAGTQASSEVVKTMILSPNSEVVVSKRTWSKVAIDFKEVVNSLAEEERSTSNSSNKELSQSSKKQDERDINLSASVSGEGKFGLAKFSAQSSTSLSFAQSKTAETSREEAETLTEDAAKRARQEHKVTYGEKTEFTSEYSTTETIRNPNRTHPVQVTLRKVLQRWRVSLVQEGVRLAVDVLIRNPGKNLREASRPEAFVPPTIDDDEISFDDPPGDLEPLVTDLEVTKVARFGEDQASVRVVFETPNGYTPNYVVAKSEDNTPLTLHPAKKERVVMDWQEHRNDFLPYHTDRVFGVGVRNRDDTEGNPKHYKEAHITAHFQPNETTKRRWLSAARSILVEEARAEWTRHIAAQRASQDQVEQNSTVPIAQILRKEEREELLSAVVQYMSEGGQSEAIEPGWYESGLSEREVTEYQEAFEWEGMSSFLFPYWWSPAAFGGEQSYRTIADLTHPDFLRREFLRASYARVIVPVRPGHEAWALRQFYPEAIQEHNADLPLGPAQIAELYRQAMGQDRQEVEEAEFPKEVGAWYEVAPTDEVHATFELLRDEEGSLMSIGEPAITNRERAAVEATEAASGLTQVVTDLVKNAEGANLDITLVSGDASSSELRVNLASGDSTDEREG